MVEIGTVIRARVARVENYGVYLLYGDQTVIVLAPEVAWKNEGDLASRIFPGQEYDVLILRFNYEKNELVGSIRRARPEENPYRELSRLEPGKTLQAKVTYVYPDEVTLRLPNGAWGHLRSWQLHGNNPKPGELLPVTIAYLDVDQGILELNLAPTSGPARHPETGSPSRRATEAVHP